MCINTIITSLVYKYTPQELRLLNTKALYSKIIRKSLWLRLMLLMTHIL